MDDKMNDVIDEVQRRLGEEYEVKRVEVMKNNDTKLKGIQVRNIKCQDRMYKKYYIKMYS